MGYGGFTTGPPTRVPEDQRECKYSQYGRYGRAWHDGWRLMVSAPAASVVVIFSVGITTTVFIVVPHADLPTKLILGVAGITTGLLIGVGLVALWALTRWGSRYHWRSRYGPFSQDPTHYPTGVAGDHGLLSLTSRHWHTVRNLRCIVTDPTGQDWSTKAWDAHDSTTHLMAPGHGANFSYPSEFGAPWPAPGKYHARWEMDAEDRVQPVVLIREKWRVGA